MPSPRYTDHGPAARPCARCRTTHRSHVPCTTPNTWLIAGTKVKTRTKEQR